MSVDKGFFYLLLFWNIFHYKQVYACTTDTVQHAKIGESVTLQFVARTVHRDNPLLFVANVIKSPNGSTLLTILYTNGGTTTTNPTCNGCTFVGDTSTGNISVRLDNLQASIGGTYKHSLPSQSDDVNCVTVYILGVPQTPTITDSNNNHEGQNITLTCSSKSTTVPTDINLGLQYNWKVNNVLNPVNSRYKYTGNMMTISNLIKEDLYKTFTCAAVESGPGVAGLSSAWSDISLLRVIYGPGKAALSPSDTSYTREENSYLDNIACTSDCYPTCHYKWTKQGNAVISGNGVLQLGTLSRNEATTYTCLVTNPQSPGFVTTNVTIYVLYGPDANSLSLDPPATTYTENEGISLQNITCSTDCYPVCNYKWTKSETSNDVSTTGILHLGSLHRNVAGLYTCIATNPESGSVTTKQVTINVRYGPDGCNINIQSPYILTEGHTPPAITCLSDCYPSCSYKWTNSSTGKVVESKEEFLLGMVTRYEAGNYTCTCQNTAITDIPKPTLLQVIVNFASLFIDGHEGQNDVIVDEYETNLRFKCTIYSYRESNIQLLFQDVLLKEKYQSTVLTFTRSNITCFHTGVYTCKGSTQQIEAPSSRINLFVRCSPRPLYQIQLNRTSSLYVPVTLTFATMAYPEPGPTGFLWYKENGMEWMPLLSNNHLLISSSGVQSNLIILNVSHSDYGRYKMNATNEIGSYVQYLFLLREDKQTQNYTTEACKVETSMTGTIIGICFGILSAGLFVYASYITILHKRRSAEKGNQTTGDPNTQITYINVAEGGTNRLNDTSGNKDDSPNVYTELVQYSKDMSTYDVIQKSSSKNIL